MSATNTGVLVAIALVSFGLGMAADRFLFDRKDAGSADSSARLPQPQLGKLGQRDADPPADHDQMPTEPYRRLHYQLERDDELVDFAEAISMADRLPPGERRRELIERIAWRWARVDPGVEKERSVELHG